jgi:hypothetical protein
MKVLKKLQNPFLLVGQGFALGALLFFATQHESGEAHSAPPAPPAAEAR